MIHRKTIFNLLLLLKKEPQGLKALFDTGCFYHVTHLKAAVSVCLWAGLIECETVGKRKLTPAEVQGHSLFSRTWHKPVRYFYITAVGSKFLFFCNGEIQKVRRVA